MWENPLNENRNSFALGKIAGDLYEILIEFLYFGHVGILRMINRKEAGDFRFVPYT